MEFNEFLVALNMNRECSDLVIESISLDFYNSAPHFLIFLVNRAEEWISAEKGATSPARQREINQSNQKNITEYIRAGRCRSLPSSSIDLQSCLQCTTVLQMKQPNLIFPHNAAIQCRYDRG